MRKRICIVFGILVFFFCCLRIFYYDATDFYSIVCSSLYYIFFYTPLYLFLISKMLEDYFRGVMILRFGSGIKNASYYMKKIVMYSILFSIWFVLWFIVLEVIVKGSSSSFDIKFYLMMLMTQIFGWSVIGFIQYFFYILIKDLSISMVITWMICGIMGLSESVLFRLKQYIYNVFQTMVLFDSNGDYGETINKMLINFVILLVIGCVILFYQKNMDIIERRK